MRVQDKFSANLTEDSWDNLNRIFKDFQSWIEWLLDWYCISCNEYCNYYNKYYTVKFVDNHLDWYCFRLGARLKNNRIRKTLTSTHL